MARRARALLAIAITVMVAATIVLPALKLLPPPWLWFARRRGFLALYAVAPNKYGDPQLISNASFSVWVFYPTKSGTVFQGIYNGTGGLVYVNLSSLVSWAEAWIDYYGPQAIYSFMPSLVVFVSYPIKVNSTTIEVASQQFMVPLNLSEPLSKEGEVIGLDVTHPFRFYYYVKPGAAGREYGGALAATIRPAQTTTTTTTVPVTTTTLYEPQFVYTYSPKVLAWYPSNDSLGPISLAIAAAQPTREFGVAATHGMVDVTLGGSAISEEGFNVVAVAGSALSAAVDDAEVGAIAQAMSALSPFVPGASLTFTKVSEVSSFNVSDAYISAGFHDVGQIYIVGQAALVNWTVRLWYVSTPSGVFFYNLPVGWQIGIMLTAVKVVESGGAVAPALYKWEAYDPCVNLALWAQEYEAIEFGGLPPSTGVPWEINQSCPIPNTPAPVDWMDYEYNITQVFPPVAPGDDNGVFYVSLEVNGGESPIGAAIDTGSALVSAGAAAALAAGLAAPEVNAAQVIAAVLGSVNFATHSAALIVNQIYVSNDFTNATLYAYISNMTPLYTSGNLKFTLPRELLLIKASAS